jgi:hypothetical protein
MPVAASPAPLDAGGVGRYRGEPEPAYERARRPILRQRRRHQDCDAICPGTVDRADRKRGADAHPLQLVGDRDRHVRRLESA